MNSAKAAKKASALLSVVLPPGSPPLSKYKLNKLMMQQQAEREAALKEAATGKRGRDSTSSGASHATAVSASELYVPRTKRPKVIVPEGKLAVLDLQCALRKCASVRFCPS